MDRALASNVAGPPGSRPFSMSRWHHTSLSSFSDVVKTSLSVCQVARATGEPKLGMSWK